MRSGHIVFRRSWGGVLLSLGQDITQEPEDSARTPGKIPTLFPMEAYTLLAFPFGNHSPAAPPVGRRACCVCPLLVGSQRRQPVARTSTKSLIKSNVSRLPLVENVLVLLESMAPRRRPSCMMIRGAYPCPHNNIYRVPGVILCPRNWAATRAAA